MNQEEIIKSILKTNTETLLIKQIQEKHDNMLKTEAKKHKITLPQIKFLLALKNNPNISQKELSQIYNINESTVTRTIYRLEKNNFIVKTNKKEIILTEQAEDTIESLKLVENNWSEEIKSQINNEEEKQLVTILSKILKETPKKQETIKKIFGQEYKTKKE